MEVATGPHAAVAGKWRLLRRRRLLSRDKSGCGRVSTKLDRAFRRLLPQDVEVAAVVRNIAFYHFTLEFLSYYKYIVNLILGVMAPSHFAWPQEEEDTLEDHIDDDDEPYMEEPFDESILTPEQSVKVDELCKENPMLTREDMAVMLRLNLMSHRATLEGRELTGIEIRMAQQLKEVFYWVPPTQLEGICNSTLELHFEDICLPCVEEIASDLNSHVLINECLDLICETRKLDDLRVEKLVRDHIEVCFDKNYLCASIDLESEFLMLDEPRPLLELADLGDELDVDRLLFEIENPLVKNFHENENIVFYLIDGDRVDNFVKTSFKPVVEFVSPPNAFDSYDHLKLKEHFIIPVTSLVKLFEEKSVKSRYRPSLLRFSPCLQVK
ncbi:hypothetical protein F2Q68_00031933 [Brassica cretica]|uniref:Uncharacterized protein n=1 Tax=Brassica cretica TaxID=69181 RepID=A0A8S9G5Y5_BRACR|nr:hypothetical protein F2Q68_00031933 [Brassica cretica]